MNKVIRLTAILLIIIFVLIFVLRSQKQVSKNAQKLTPTPVVSYTKRPEQTAINFYDQYLKNQNYKQSKYLTYAFRQKLDKLKNSAVTYDPILCAQNIPISINISSATISSKLIYLFVTENFSSESINHKVEFEKEGDFYKISNIVCGL